VACGMAHSNMVSVDVRMVPDSTFLLTSWQSEEIPMCFESGWDGVLVLSRENSEKLFLSRENSLSRESSAKLALGKDNFDQLVLSRESSDIFVNQSGALALSRENSDKLSDCLGRENSGFLASLANETTGDLEKMISLSSNESISSSATRDKIENSVQQQSQQPLQLDMLRTGQQQEVTTRMDVGAECSATAVDISSRECVPRPRRPPAPRESRRGAHVRDRPDMQRTARDGAAHWANCVRKVRAEWVARNLAFRAEYGSQVEAAQGRIKSKQECLLRFLQMAADDGVVVPGPFVTGGGFFGWTRFAVVPGRAEEFRRALEALFPDGFREDTLKETFRRSGLIPERWQWEHGWRGTAAFQFRERGSAGHA
jgi:hypothetical protein